jgi:hypothetical protein
MSDEPENQPPYDGPRMNGLLLVLLLVLGGMGIGSFYYRIKAPGIIREMRAMRDGIPTAGEPRLEKWMEFGAPMIHGRLTKLRLSSQQPWLVTHVVESDQEGRPGEVWGVDFTDLPIDIIRRDGMQVVIELPAATPLAEARLVGEHTVRVPRYARNAEIPNPNRRVEEMIRYALRHPDDFIARVEREIEGASIVVRCGEDTVNRGE